MFDTYRMLGREHEADLEREAAQLHRADPFRRQRRRVARVAFVALAIAAAMLLVWLFAFPG